MNSVLPWPEIFIGGAGLALMMFGVFRGGNPTRPTAWLSVAAMIVAIALTWWTAAQGEASVLGGMYVSDNFAAFLKILVLVSSALSIIMSLGYIEREQMARFEFPLLMLFATLGMLMMVSANNLIALYIGLELQSLALYVVAAFRRDSLRSTEAGLKYFVLGALSSGILLYGASMVYGFAGTTSFPDLAAILASDAPSDGLIVGMVFLIAGLAFKVSAVPFHMWTPDVYEGAPTPVTAFFSVAPKLAAMGLLVRVMIEPFGHLLIQWQQIVWIVAVASMILGALAAINQTNIKRLMAYSSIGNVGYALVGLAAGTQTGVRSLLIYMAIYIVMNIGTFACILCMRRKDRMVETIGDLAGLSRTHPRMALALGIFMFSLAGIPPLAGFFAKFYVFLAAVDAKLYVLAVIGVVTSVVGAYYYVRIVKIMYFDEPAEPFDRAIGWEMRLIMGVTAAFMLLFVLITGPLLSGSGIAAASLFAG
jgi:NADH-quinone oxidoreductase subunit N